MAGTIECGPVHRALREHGPRAVRDDPALVAHLEDCPACAALSETETNIIEVLGELDEPADEPLDYATLERELSGQPGLVERVRQAPTPARTALLAIAAAICFGLVFATLPRADLGLVPLPRLLVSLVLLMAAVVAAGAWVVRPLQRPALSRGASYGVLLVGLLAPLAISVLPAAHQLNPSSLAGVGEDLVPRALGCFGFGMGLTLIALAAAWLVDREQLQRASAAVLAFVGAAALANATLVVHCPLVAPVHKLTGHATVSLAALGLAGLVMGLRRSRSQRSG